MYRNNGDSRQLRSLHCAAADWQWNTRDEAALASVSRHYAAGLNAEAFFHGEVAAVMYRRSVLTVSSSRSMQQQPQHAACRRIETLVFQHAVLSDGLDPAKAREWDLYVCRAFLLVNLETACSP